MKHFMLTSGLRAALGFAVLLSSGQALARERVVRAVDVPRAVREAVASRYGAAAIIGYAREQAGREVTFEARVRVSGTTADVDVSPAGEILAEERRITLDDLPVEARAAVAKELGPRAEIVQVERVTKGDRQEAPEFEVQARKGRERVELTVDRSGRLVGRQISRGPR